MGKPTAGPKRRTTEELARRAWDVSERVPEKHYYQDAYDYDALSERTKTVCRAVARALYDLGRRDARKDRGR